MAGHATPLGSLRGRDLRALGLFREKLKASIGRGFERARFLSRRPIELPAGSAPPGARIPRAARQSGGDASPPAARGSPEGSAPFSGRKPGSAAARSAPPPPEPPPGELRVLVLVERRDAWVDDRVDEAALEVALSEGVLITPFVYTAEEFGSPLSAATPLGAEAARGEEF